MRFERKEFLSQRNLLVIASLPLYVNWYFVLLFYYENETLRKQSFKSAILTFFFFLLLTLSWLASKLPFFGSFLANFLHLSAILFYAGFSIFFIYKIFKEEKVELGFLENQVKKLETFLS